MARLRLTEAVIKAAKPAQQDFVLWDTEVRGFGCKITPAGKKVFFVYYRTRDGQQRRPSIGPHGALKCETARQIAQELLSAVAKGGDPSSDRQEARSAPIVRDACERFMREYAAPRSKQSYLKQQRRMIDTRIVPAIGSMKIAAVTRSHVVALHTSLRDTPYEANRVLALLSVIFSQGELWGLRPEGSNPCRLVPRFPERRRERLLSDAEVQRIFNKLEEAERAGSEATSVILAIRLLFATACRASEILGLRWEYLHKETGEIVWPDNKAGGELRKPLTEEVASLLRFTNRTVGNPFVCVSGDRSGTLPMSSLEKAWRRLLKQADVKHCGLHAIRHRAATDIANDASIPLHVAMKLTGHKTLATLQRYLHVARDQAKDAAERVNQRRGEMVRATKTDVVRLDQAASAGHRLR